MVEGNGCCEVAGPGYGTPLEAMSGPREALIYVTCVYTGTSTSFSLCWLYMIVYKWVGCNFSGLFELLLDFIIEIKKFLLLKSESW